MTKKSEEFIKANDKSPVIIGAAIGNGGKGGIYTLANGKRYTLNLEDCQALPVGYPKWKGIGK